MTVLMAAIEGDTPPSLSKAHGLVINRTEPAGYVCWARVQV